MNEFPTGTVTFLFTDIEGSTELWEKYPDAMDVALPRHDAIMREAIKVNEGVVFKMNGDAFCAAFPDAPKALHAAVAAQLALYNEPWPADAIIRVRMAVHTGRAQLRGTDYFSRDLNRMARLLSAGHGRQTLVSTVSQGLMRGYLPKDVTLRDLGSHYLRSLQEPEQIFQVVHPDLPDTLLPGNFPPLKTLDSFPNNLPQNPTSFIGRETVIADITARLGKTRLLTLTGSGGSGKTRLALEVADDVSAEYPDGVWFVELAPLADPALVAQTVASVMGVKEQAGQTITQTLTYYLQAKRVLLVLDNCEHLLSACAEIAAAFLRSCREVRVLAASREPLGIAGEQTLRVPPLSRPAPQNRAATAQSLSQYEAVRLFIERAQAKRPDFAVTNANAPALAQVCYRLDGIPLALELAAARARAMSVEEINTGLDRLFSLLTGGDKAALPRQQTLRAAVDWSYNLLQEPEKALFNRLSIFAGGWTMEAAKTVCAFAPLEAFAVLDVLTSLVDKSLVLAEEADGDGTTRYRMLETLRQYGAEKRDANGETGEVKAKYRDYFMELAEEASTKMGGLEQAAWLNRLESEHDNLRAVLDDCALPDANAEEAGLRLAGALWEFWSVRGYFSEGRERTTRALERGQSLGRGQWIRWLQAKATTNAGNLAGSQGDYEAAQNLHNESLAIDRELGDKQGIAASLGNLGIVAKEQGDYVAARSLHNESLVLSRELGDKQGVAASLGNLGNVTYYQGDYVAARLQHEESLAIHRDLGDKRGIAASLINLGDVADKQKDYLAARARYEESIVLCRDIGDRQNIAYCLEGLGSVCLGENDARKAVGLLGAANALREILGAPLPPFEKAENDEEIAQARLALDEAAFSAAWEQGRAMTWEQAADYAVLR